MKRFLIILLAIAICFTGCGKKKQPTDIPGGEEAPEGVDWRNWETYTAHTLVMGEETVDVLIALDAIHLAIYFDQDEQELMGSLTIFTPLTDIEYSRKRLRIQDLNGDGYDDLSVPDMLTNGDRMIESWVWDSGENTYLYAPEYSELQKDIAADISWQQGKFLKEGIWNTPEGSQSLLIGVDGNTVLIYLNQREEELVTQFQLPEDMSEEARGELLSHSFWELKDRNADGWGDLQIPYRWEETENGVCVYAYCWLWQPESGTFRLDPERSEVPVY